MLAILIGWHSVSRSASGIPDCAASAMQYSLVHRRRYAGAVTASRRTSFLHLRPATGRVSMADGTALTLPHTNTGRKTSLFLANPAWVDGIVIAASLALCGFAEQLVGGTVAAWAAITVCVTTSLRMDGDITAARERSFYRLLGTAAGIALAVFAGHSWIAMAVWGTFLTIIRRRVSATQGYACVVAALTYAVVGLGDAQQSAIKALGMKRLIGVGLGASAVLFCFLALSALRCGEACLRRGLMQRAPSK